MLISTSSQARNMSRYLAGFSSPTVIAETMMRVLADLELGRAHEVAHVLDHEQVDVVERQVAQRRAHHVRVEVTLAEARGGIR